MMLCGHCNAPIERGETFCRACGTPIDWADAAAEQPVSVPPKRTPMVLGLLGTALMLGSSFLIIQRFEGFRGGSGLREVDFDRPGWAWGLAFALILPVVLGVAAVTAGSGSLRFGIAGAAVLLAAGVVNTAHLFITVVARFFQDDSSTLAEGFYVKFAGAFIVGIAGLVGWLSSRADGRAPASL